MKGPTILSKGPVDAIANLKFTSICDVQSSSKRSGGQGSVLAGIVGALVPAIAKAQVSLDNTRILLHAFDVP